MRNKLYLSNTDKKIGGVCGGIAEYFNTDSTIVRIIAVILGLCSIGILIYLAAWIIMPRDAFV